MECLSVHYVILNKTDRKIKIQGLSLKLMMEDEEGGWAERRAPLHQRSGLGSFAYALAFGQRYLNCSLSQLASV